MIYVKLNKGNFEYDIHSLVKAFYPAQEVTVTAEEKKPDEAVLFWLYVEYLDETSDPGRITFRFKGESKVTGESNPSEGELQEDSDEDELYGEIEVNHGDRRDTKNRLKQKLYELLCTFSGQTLPWGTLTGIRPTKIPMAMLEEGKSRTEIEAYMRETYFASREKIDLSIEVAERELSLLQNIDYENGYSLYVGIPFCPSTCLYCSFTSYPVTKWEGRMDEYMDALCKELDFVAASCSKKVLNTIYIGGGTPTSLNPEQLHRMITKLEESFDFSHLLEFTVEAGRPDSITREKLQVLRDHNISRISINPQTMKQATLDLIGRRHTVKQTIDSFKLAREMGFDNINMDLIIGLPEETIEDVRDTMEQLAELKPDNLTVHSLAVKRAARLRMNREEYQDLHMENTWETIALTADYAKKMGMHPYYLYRQKNMAGNFENVGYAKEDCDGLYNILIMEEKQTIMAVGAGASTKFVFDHGKRIERVENVKDITNYLERTDEMIERKQREMEEIKWH